ncbi:MAG: peroxiredoxin [Bacteroidales bacterium]
MKKIALGSKLPVFSLKDQDNKIINSHDFIGRKNLVIYFYPKDDTPGCTAEACSFRDEFEDFKTLDAEVIGISSDSPASHKKFAEKYNLTFRLLSDEDNEVRKLFRVPTNFLGLLPGRVTYIIDKTGIVQHVFNSQFNARKHVSEAKKILESLS